MPRSMHLLCAAAVGLAACGSKDDMTNLANSAANSAASAANTASNAAGNAADTASNAAGNAANSAQSAADTAQAAVRTNFRGCPKYLKRSKPQACMIVKFGSTVYDIDSARPRPEPGRLIIQGSGIKSPKTGGPCIVGQRLTQVKWHYTKLQCPMSGK